jgi:6-phosphogluconolactonase
MTDSGHLAGDSDVHVLADGDQLASSVASHLAARLDALQRSGTTPYLVLTGGRTGIAVLESLRVAAAGSVEWGYVHLFWGDDRFVPGGDADRNELQAGEALLEHVSVNPAHVHRMEPSDGRYGADPDAAAQGYERMLQEVARPGQPLFDICLLGVGEEGHVASIFPDSPAVTEGSRSVVGVVDCPKPPPTRVSLTLPTIRRSREVWLMTTGAAKATAVAAALRHAPPSDVPAAGAVGLERTLWFLDPPAAAALDKPLNERAQRRVICS